MWAYPEAAELVDTDRLRTVLETVVARRPDETVSHPYWSGARYVDVAVRRGGETKVLLVFVVERLGVTNQLMVTDAASFGRPPTT